MLIRGRWKALGGGCSVFVIAGACKGCWEEVCASYRKTVACLWSTCGRGGWKWSKGNDEEEEAKRGRQGGRHGPGRVYLYGEAVCHHHDDQRDEEGHEGADQHEALLVEDAAAVDEDLVLVAKADDGDRHRHAWGDREKGSGSVFRPLSGGGRFT